MGRIVEWGIQVQFSIFWEGPPLLTLRLRSRLRQVGKLAGHPLASLANAPTPSGTCRLFISRKILILIMIGVNIRDCLSSLTVELYRIYIRNTVFC